MEIGKAQSAKPKKSKKMASQTPLDLIDAAIANLEAKLNLPPGGSIAFDKKVAAENPNQNSEGGKAQKKNKKNKGAAAGGAGKGKGKNTNSNAAKKGAAANVNQPDICKLEFKVGQITKVWLHPNADKLYCEEIDCGEEAPRQIASGLRPHYTLEQMEGQRLIVVSNLKVRRKERETDEKNF